MKNKLTFWAIYLLITLPLIAGQLWQGQQFEHIGITVTWCVMVLGVLCALILAVGAKMVEEGKSDPKLTKVIDDFYRKQKAKSGLSRALSWIGTGAIIGLLSVNTAVFTGVSYFLVALICAACRNYVVDTMDDLTFSEGDN